jgi:hypothetical protein
MTVTRVYKLVTLVVVTNRVYNSGFYELLTVVVTDKLYS